MTPREKLELLRSYRAAGGTGSYASLLKEAKEYAAGGPKSKLPPLPSYTNIQPTQDNIRMQYTPVDPIQRDAAEVEARKLRVAKREKELQEYYSQSGMISGMKRKPTPSEVKAHAESSVSYNDKLYNDPVGTLGPDIAMSVIPELMMLKGPQQAISRGLNKLNPFKSYNPWSKPIQNTIKQVDDIPTPKFISEIDWAKWNPDTPKYPELINEYNTIEESAKKAGTWMKNTDGSTFQGTPEQFIQQQSSWFKKAYPSGVGKTYRGAKAHYPELTDRDSRLFGKSIFTANEDLAKGYGYPLDNYYTPHMPTAYDMFEINKANRWLTTEEKKWSNVGGRHELYYPKSSNEIIIDAENKVWREINSKYGKNTNNVASYIENNNIDRAIIKNVNDGGIGDILINNQTPGNYLKSARGNIGFFDMTNPNIYKVLLPVGLGTGLYNKTTNN